MPLAVAGNTIAVFSSIHAVRRQTDVAEAFEVSVRLFMHRWLESFETGVILLGVKVKTAFDPAGRFPAPLER